MFVASAVAFDRRDDSSARLAESAAAKLERLTLLPKLFARAVLVKELRQKALPSAHAQGSLQFLRPL